MSHGFFMEDSGTSGYLIENGDNLSGALLYGMLGLVSILKQL
jgi:hypothetical protein